MHLDEKHQSINALSISPLCRPAAAKHFSPSSAGLSNVSTLKRSAGKLIVEYWAVQQAVQQAVRHSPNMQRVVLFVRKATAALSWHTTQ